jgi:hypothetical protein
MVMHTFLCRLICHRKMMNTQPFPPTLILIPLLIPSGVGIDWNPTEILLLVAVLLVQLARSTRVPCARCMHLTGAKTCLILPKGIILIATIPGRIHTDFVGRNLGHASLPISSRSSAIRSTGQPRPKTMTKFCTTTSWRS